MSVDQAALAKFGKTMAEEIERRLREERKQTSEEAATLKARIECLEEQIQGLVLYLGQQAHRNGWKPGDINDATSVKAAKRYASIKHDNGQYAGEHKLPYYAAMPILAINTTSEAAAKA